MKAKSVKARIQSIETLNAVEPDKPRFVKANVISQARNPQWVFASVEGVEGKSIVAIPRRLTNKLEGKQINVEVITDENGTSYRHEFLST
jgi:hypothetical protein